MPVTRGNRARKLARLEARTRSAFFDKAPVCYSLRGDCIAAWRLAAHGLRQLHALLGLRKRRGGGEAVSPRQPRGSTSSCSVTAALELRSPRFDSVPKKVPDQRQLYNKRVARYYIAKYLSKPVEHQMDSRTHRVRRGRGWSATKKCEYSSCAFMNTFHFCFAAPSGRPGRSGNGRLG